MSCSLEHREALLVAYGARQLDPPAAAAFERHIECCEECRRLAAAQSAVWEALDRWQAPPVAADFDRRLYRRIEEQVSWWDLLIRPFRPAFSRAAAAAAAAAVVLMAGLLLDRPSSPPVAVAQRAVQAEAIQPDQVENALAEIEMLHQFNRLMRAEPVEANPKM